jgi:hypothetical protein
LSFFSNDLRVVHKIILEEHNKVCPKGQEEMEVTSMELFSLLLYSKYNLTADLSNVINAVDSIEIDHDDDDDDDAEDDFQLF